MKTPKLRASKTGSALRKIKRVDKTPIKSINLHKKYRPTRINDLVGQDSIKVIIKGWIKSGVYPSTILITGCTGSGKTTTARMIHNSINCGKDRESERLGNSHPDYKELNMGALGRIDDVRNLILTSDVMPSIGKKKIIVLDEAHRMTDAASSALLKPLEEPSEDTIWILCTTDPEKLLSTITNRCVVLPIKPIEPKLIRQRLKQIVISEKVSMPNKTQAGEALDLISNFAEGQMRKALSQLQSLLGAVQGGEKFDSKSVMDLYSQSGEADLDSQAVDLMVSMLTYDLSETIKICNTNGNPRGLVAKMLWLTDWIIQSNTGSMSFSPFIGKLFNSKKSKILKDKDLSKDFKEAFQIPNLINIMDVLLQITITWNTSGISERMLLSTWMAKVVANDYEYTTNR
jgi:DNA polymerase III subunit gamma/tau